VGVYIRMFYSVLNILSGLVLRKSVPQYYSKMCVDRFFELMKHNGNYMYHICNI
jgi:hypothetical protein